MNYKNIIKMQPIILRFFCLAELFLRIMSVYFHTLIEYFHTLQALGYYTVIYRYTDYGKFAVLPGSRDRVDAL